MDVFDDQDHTVNHYYVGQDDHDAKYCVCAWIQNNSQMKCVVLFLGTKIFTNDKLNILSQNTIMR